MIDRQKTAAITCSRAKEAARKLTNGHSVGERGFKKYEEKFKELPNTVDDIEKEIDETQTRAEFLRGGSMDVSHKITNFN